ncbi:MAG: isochorismate synthase [Anaerolinea sp.]|nr:isochorismate synthase [Anaerolinea sp.]
MERASAVDRVHPARPGARSAASAAPGPASGAAPLASPAPEALFVGIGAAAAISAEGALRFARAQLRIADLFTDALIAGEGPRLAQPRLFGGFSFTPDFQPAGLWSAFPPALLILPHFQYTVCADGRWLTVSRLFDSDSTVASSLQRLQDDADAFLASAGAAAIPMAASAHPVAIRPQTDVETWRSMVIAITTRIRAGELKKAVLARALDIVMSGAPDLITALARLDARYSDTYRFLIQPADGHAFLGASPELIASVDRGILRTAALAGSRPRRADPETDAALAAELLASPKEREEHQLVVQALRRRIALYARQVTIPDEPIIMRLKNIQHLYTPVEAQLETRFGVLDLINELHPTPALGGEPSYAAQRLIAGLETTPRGWYAAPVGWVDAAGDGMFAVAIRSAVIDGSNVRLYAGAGIVADSDPDAEWHETETKFKPLLEALTGAEANAASGLSPEGVAAHERAQS